MKDLRKDDLVTVRKLRNKDWDKIYNLTRRECDSGSAANLKNLTESKVENLNKFQLKIVTGPKLTEKTKTEFVRLNVGGNFYIDIQARYIILKSREAKHKLTKLFLPDEVLKNRDIKPI